jgi:hypothetical protein
MTKIDVGSHHESVLQFVLSLPQNSEGIGLRMNGRPSFGSIRCLRRKDRLQRYGRKK